MTALACLCGACGAAFDAEPAGGHRLMCGDSTSAETLDAALAGARPQLCLTDPPYGIGESYDSIDDTKDALAGLIDGFLPLARARCEVVLLTPGNSNQMLYPEPKWTLAWFVPAGTGTNRWGFTCWQPVLAYGRDPYLRARKGSRPDALVLKESADNSLGHPCPKPVKVWTWFMERGSVNKGDVVFDPFGGSGTGIIAAEISERHCVAVELSPVYVDVATRRFQLFTGTDAILEGDGRTFAEIAEARDGA